MNENSEVNRGDFRVLEKLEVDDLYRTDLKHHRVRVSREHPILGELIIDSSGAFFLTPEEDFRGGNAAAIPIAALTGDQVTRFLGRLVKIAGTYEEEVGLTVEWIALDPPA